MLLTLYRFVRGWLCVRFYGNNVSRFLNLCTRHGIVLWNVCSQDSDCLETGLYVKDLYNLKPILRKTKVHFRITERKGLPFLVYRYRKRKVFAGVIVCVAVVMILLSTKIWRIEVLGNSSISEETVLEYLASHDITYGTSRSEIDNDALELSLRQDFEPIIWASVYEKGTKLVVHVQEKIASDRIVLQKEDSPIDLVAKKDATVKSIITRKGIGLVKAGDTVKKGDILVAGKQEILDDSGEVKEYYYETADADVIGIVNYDYEDWIEEKTVEKAKTGQKHTRFFVRLMDYQMTTPALHVEYEYSAQVEQNRQLCLMDSFYLPVYYGTITDFEEERTVQNIEFQDAKDLALEHLNHFLTNLEQNGVSIIDKNVMIEKIELKYHIYGKVTAEETITTQQPTEILPDPVSSTEEQEEQ